MNRRERRRAEARHQELLDVLEAISIGVGGDQNAYVQHVTDLTRQLEVVSASLTDSEANNVRLENSIGLLTQENARLKEDSLKYESLIIQLQSDHKTGNLAELRQENERLKAAILNDERQFKQLREENARLKAEALKDERLIGQLQYGQKSLQTPAGETIQSDQGDARGGGSETGNRPVVPPSQPLPALSALATKHGERIVALDAEFLSPDAIASEINEGLDRNDRINTLQVNKVLLEMKRLGKAVKS